MRKLLVLSSVVLSILILSSFKTLKEAYQEEGIDIYGETHWLGADMPIKYSINELGSADISGDAEFTAINDAITKWTEVNCGSYYVDLKVEYLGKTSERVGYFDGKNTIDFVENKNEWPPEAGANAIAFTLPSIREDGIIVEVDIRFNGVNYTWGTTGGYSRMDVETIALHELGHFFGLADLYDNYSCYTIEAVMCGYGGGGTKRVLTQDDKDGICYLYDPNKYYACNRSSDCKDGLVCKAYVNLEGKTTTYCLEPYCVPANLNDPYCNDLRNTKAVDMGFKCGDVNNTPLNKGDDIFCKNRMCLSSGVCSGVCVDDKDCPQNMKCQEITIKIDENIDATLKACNTPVGCKSNRGCTSDKACTIFRAGNALVSVCNNYIGQGDAGAACLVDTDCKTGLCYQNYCSSFCTINSDCSIYGNNYVCTKDIDISYEGLTDKFSICTRSNVITDAGVDVLTDISIDTQDTIDHLDVYVKDVDVSTDSIMDLYDYDVTDVLKEDGIVDAINLQDTVISKDIVKPDTSSECICDVINNCDPDCECDPECLDEKIESKGCGCSLIN